jgi:hypothetical protein
MARPVSRTRTPGDPCGALTWRVRWQDFEGRTFTRDFQAAPDRDRDAVPDSSDNCPDAYIPPDSPTAYVRVERSGAGNGRVYTIYFTASDGRGGSCQGSGKVSVPHDASGGSVIDDGPLYDSTVRTPWARP